MKSRMTIVVVVLLLTTVHASSFKVVHSFNSDGKDGYDPVAGLVFDAAGNLYGTTIYGGAYGMGTVFELKRTADGGWAEKILHNFNSNGRDGYNPYANLTFDANGNLYGTTCNGGLYDHGTVFELVPRVGGAWTEKVLHSFNNTDGACTYAGLILDASGNLYGTVYAGGPAGGGAVFELTLTGSDEWTERILHAFNFDEENGGYPEGSLVFDANGDLYGATRDNQSGVVFELVPVGDAHWTYNVAYRFNNKDGSDPDAPPILDAAGNLFGTTYVGGTEGNGTVFELTANGKGGWTEKVLHNFDGKDGVFVYAGLVFDTSGDLYGTAVEGGTYNHGTAYELMPTVAGSWTAKLLHTFNTKDGMYPWATLVRDAAGNLYGTTTGGGEYGYGVVFEITLQD